MAVTDNTTRLVVGLGNPGRKYANTRHNVGFDVIEAMANRHAADTGRLKFEGDIRSCVLHGWKLLLVRPQTYMNLSGRCVSAVAKFYKLDPETSLLVVCDDISLPTGKLRICLLYTSPSPRDLNPNLVLRHVL